MNNSFIEPLQLRETNFYVYSLVTARQQQVTMQLKTAKCHLQTLTAVTVPNFLTVQC
jgi:hypothetical protein